MEYNFAPIDFGNDDVILIDGCTYLVSILNKTMNIYNYQIRKKIVETMVQDRLVPDDTRGFQFTCDEGKECKILRVGAPSWVKGKIRIKMQIEFAPDEHEIIEVVTTKNQESPLDDLRRAITESK